MQRQISIYQSSVTICHPVFLPLASSNQQDWQKTQKHSSKIFSFLISDHLHQLLILKDFHPNSTVTNNIVYERNSGFFNDNKFKNNLKSIPWENTLSQVNLLVSSAFDLLFKQINTLLGEHAPIHKLSKNELSLKKKPWINKIIQSLMRERIRFFKTYCQETNSTVKLTKHNGYKRIQKTLTKHNGYKRIRNIVVSKIEESKKQYYQNYFQRNSKNLKKYWDGIKSVVTLKSKTKTSPNSFFVDRIIIANKASSLRPLIMFCKYWFRPFIQNTKNKKPFW